MNLLISAGEASGDLHGARLLSALKKRRPDLTAFGMGGERLEAAGLERVVASEALSVVGISEVFEKLPALWRAIAALRDARPAGRRPDAAVLIDFPDFHGWLARRLAPGRSAARLLRAARRSGPGGPGAPARSRGAPGAS